MKRVTLTFPESLRRQCMVDGRSVHLSPFEAELLALLLMTPPGHMVDYRTIIEVIWPDPDTQAWSTGRCISVLRVKLVRKGIAIETEYGVGYRSIPAEFRGGRPERRRDPVLLPDFSWAA